MSTMTDDYESTSHDDDELVTTNVKSVFIYLLVVYILPEVWHLSLFLLFDYYASCEILL